MLTPEHVRLLVILMEDCNIPIISLNC